MMSAETIEERTPANSQERDMLYVVQDVHTDRLLSTNEVKLRLGTTIHVVNKLIRYNLLSAVKFGRVCKVSSLELNKFITDVKGVDVLALLNNYSDQQDEAASKEISNIVKMKTNPC